MNAIDVRYDSLGHHGSLMYAAAVRMKFRALPVPRAWPSHLRDLAWAECLLHRSRVDKTHAAAIASGAAASASPSGVIPVLAGCTQRP